MMRHAVGITAFLILLGIAGAAWWLLAARRPETPPAPTTPLEMQDIEIRLNKVRIRGVSGGVITWEIEADKFDMAKHTPVLRMQGLRNIALINGDTRELTLSANALERNVYTGDITLTGQVTVTGEQLLLRAPTVHWDARREVLSFPQRVAAQVGEYLLNIDGGLAYDVKAATLHCMGGILLTLRGNTLRAGSAEINLRTQAFTLSAPVSASLDVADLESWTSGQSPPEIPPIPQAVQERYREYCKNQETRRPSTLRGIR